MILNITAGELWAASKQNKFFLLSVARVPSFLEKEEEKDPETKQTLILPDPCVH